jgi:hypothetical protein
MSQKALKIKFIKLVKELSKSFNRKSKLKSKLAVGPGLALRRVLTEGDYFTTGAICVLVVDDGCPLKA